MQDCEIQIRRELAAAYRLIAHFGWDDHVATHLSARLPDGSFLINQFGQLFDEVTAANLVRVSMQGEVISPAESVLNPAGFNIHAGIYDARADTGSVMHLHTHAGVAVSALEDGLLPLSQTAMIILPDVAYHEFEGIADREQERESLARDLGTKNLLILRNHGTLSVGETIADAFYRLYCLEWSCITQMSTLSAGRSVHLPDPVAAAEVGNAIDWSNPKRFSVRAFWPAMLRKAYRIDSTFDDLTG
ncbi:class II aldolase [Altererythrobacter aquaemixtae]|uniref:Class II aldolase n=2 Tax=Pontixanthobacter aquaemixtae TaxID=1958940 RepID=A0A844ZQ97_9SPHN|nr:class II aldolase [Pontixanthobacter aquaemixtae]